jgi:hypothetical protein
MVDNMTGYVSKRAAARDKLDDDDALTIAYQSGYYDGKKAAQRTWVGLTAEEILDLFDATNVYGSKWIEFSRAVEAKLKEKNT